MNETKITKRLIAIAFKDLTREKPVSKINITDISQKCLINRKSFYYHFKDKEDLINWIFDDEFLRKSRKNETFFELINSLTEYLYNNKSFYRKLLKWEGQNSFSEHLHSIFAIEIKEGIEAVSELQINFIADGIISAVKRWLLSYNPCSPHEISNQINSCIFSFN